MCKCCTADIMRVNLTFVYPCIANRTVNDDQQDATILAYLFIPNRLIQGLRLNGEDIKR